MRNLLNLSVLSRLCVGVRLLFDISESVVVGLRTVLVWETLVSVVFAVKAVELVSGLFIVEFVHRGGY